MRSSLMAVAALVPWFIVGFGPTFGPPGAPPAEGVVPGVEPVYQGTGDGAPALSALDYAEIQMLYGRSNISFDSGGDRGYALARPFTPDGVLAARGSAPISGHAQLATLAAKNASCLQTWLTNLMIEPSPDGAVGWAYIWQIELACGSRPAAVTSGSNTAVKEGGLYR